MATIASVTTHRLTIPLHTPFVTALRRTDTAQTVVLQVRDSDGVIGFGEAPQVWQVTGESLEGAQACLETMLAPVLLGRDADDVAALIRETRRAVHRNAGAKMAVDIALHDLAARRRGVPLVTHLGGIAREVPTDVTLSAGTPAELAAAARARVAEGFTVLKLKIGTDAAHDVERVLAVRSAIGPEVTLRADANQGWTPREAVTVIRALEDAGAGLELVEQPVRGEDLDGLGWVTDRVATPVLADEGCYDARDLARIIAGHSADMVNVKLAKCGGIAAARAMIAMAREHQVGVLVGSMMEGAIGVGAAAALVAAEGLALVPDLDAGWWAASSPVAGGVRYDAARVVLADAPGLGIDALA